MPQNPGPVSRLVKRPVTIAEKRLCQVCVGINQRRHYVHFRIPEIVALIALSRQTLGAHAVFPVSGSRLKDMEQVEPHALQERVISLDHHIRLIPHGFHTGLLIGRLALKAFFYRLL